MSPLPHPRAASAPAIAAAASLTLVTACASAEEPDETTAADPGVNEADAAPTGFTDHSGFVVAALTGVSSGEGGRAQEVVLTVHDPEEGTQRASITAGEVSAHGSMAQGSLRFTQDFSHVAYLEEQTDESDLLVYRLEGQEHEAELIHRIEPPSDSITGGYRLGGLSFQPDGERLWYAVYDSDDEAELRSIGMAEEEEPKDEGTAEFPNWTFDTDGELVEFQTETTETELDRGSASVEYFTYGQTFSPSAIDFTAPGARHGEQLQYRTVQQLGEDGEYLAGGKLSQRGSQGDEHEWGPLMRLTLNESGEVEAHETVIPEMERHGVDGLQVSPSNDAAVILASNRNAGNTYARDTDVYFVDLDDPDDPRLLETVLPERESASDTDASVSIVGWLE
ncbi:hypothetical protein [Nocardiopsis oceani]